MKTRELAHHRVSQALRAIALACSLALLSPGAVRGATTASLLNPSSDANLPDGATLALPTVGSSRLCILAPDVLELMLITTQPAGGPPAQWNFVSGGVLTLPATSQFQVTANGQNLSVSAVGFKRRARYAPNKARDLRIINHLYLRLAQAVPDGSAVNVTNPDGTLWNAAVPFTATAAPLRWSPVLHVNQEGYVPGHAMRASVGYYLGSMGELTVPTSGGFSLIDDAGTAVFSGQLTARPEQGYNVNLVPAPYQKVYQADFTAFQVTGRYRLKVPGLGTSFPFRIDGALAGSFARVYALGLYHQRCGSDNALPFTRFLHGICHAPAAQIPDMSSTFTSTNNFISASTAGGPAQTAPVMTSVAASLYPFVNSGTVDVHGGHHDAGDYSKYLINCAQLVHHLCFAADNFTGVAALDNLGLPESGNGKSDVLELAKWEADYLVRIQDADGGFSFLTYPRDAKYEYNVTPDHGYPQVVWPKNTSVTACATAALAQMSTSPTFKQQFPAAAAGYLDAARRGWAFLQSAWTAHGRAGAYQYVTFYGKDFTDLDEIVWAETEMYLATGDPAIHAQLLADFDPSSSATIKWNWWRLFESYGCAVRDYAFAASSGRVATGSLDATFLSKCQSQIDLAGQDQLGYANGSAYGVSYAYPDKRYGNASWFNAMSRAFDLAVANARTPNPSYMDAILSNINYEAGSNPWNVSFVAGMGWLRQREHVNQYEANARRRLPPSGIPIGSLTSLMPYLSQYTSELRDLPYPSDSSTTNPHGIYDRWTDTWNVQAEIVTCLAARGLAAALPLLVASPVRDQAYSAIPATVTGVSSTVPVGVTLTPGLQVSGVDLSPARIVWEASGAEPVFSGASCSFTPLTTGPGWLEAEALLPDGRRAFGVIDFTVGSTSEPAPTPAPTPTSTTTVTHYIYDPAPGATLSGSSATIRWTTVTGATGYAIKIGRSPGGTDFVNATNLAWPSYTVNNLPTDGSTVYVRLSWVLSGVTGQDDVSYQAAGTTAPPTPTPTPTPTTHYIYDPVPDSTLTATSATIRWTTVKGGGSYAIKIGRSAGSTEFANASKLSSSTYSVNNLPTDGSPIYVRLSWQIKGVSYQDNVTYEALLR